MMRILILDNLLRSNRSLSPKKIAEHAEVSCKTVLRDLDLLRKIGAPVVKDSDSKRYLYRDRNWMPDLYAGLKSLKHQTGW